MPKPDRPELIERIAEIAASKRGRSLLVGGCVRDDIMGFTPKDFDMELFGISETDVEVILRDAGASVVRCGRSFPVWKAWDETMGQGEAIDVALPRRERKAGLKHTDFSVQLDPSLSFEDASSRRDFTMNAIGLDPLTSEILDPHQGRADIAAGVLRHVSPQFAEDPLRVLRGAQFCGRFGLKADPNTLAFCRTLTPEGLSKERLWEEWKKLILKSRSPSKGLRFLEGTGWLRYFPELEAIIGVNQDPGWHLEGDVWTHTLHCMDAFAETRSGVEGDDLAVGFAVLCHDLGKASTTKFFEGKWRAHGHEAAGAVPTQSFLRQLTDETGFIQGVSDLVVAHMHPKELYKQAKKGQGTDRGVRRLATQVRIDLIARVAYCDSAGRPPHPKEAPDAEWLIAEAARLMVSNSRPKPLVLGRDLIGAGKRPRPEFGPALAAAYNAQLDGLVSTKEDALAHAIVALEGNILRTLDGKEPGTPSLG